MHSLAKVVLQRGTMSSMLPQDQVKRNFEIMKKHLEKEAAKKPKFLYQHLESNTKVKDFDADSLLEEEDCIEAMRWLRSQLEEALKKWNEQKQKFGGHVLQPTIEMKKKMENPKFAELLDDLTIKKGPSGDWLIPKTDDYICIKNRLDLLVYYIGHSVDFNECKVCKYQYSSVICHLVKTPKCKSSYSEDEWKELKEAAEYVRKKRKKELYQSNKQEYANRYQEKKQDILEKRKRMKPEIAKYKAEYYERNRSNVQDKALEYYAKNKDEISKKKAEYYQKNKALIKARRKAKTLEEMKFC